MKRFRAGDRVEALQNYISGNGKIRAGYRGTVCDDTMRYNFGVKWDKYIEGHDCRDTCEHGYGWYVSIGEITLIEDEDVSDIDDVLFLDVIRA